ncbi:cupin domain-containing protein [Paenibacillus dakarensis]|uniref:cupin domain-containing protein n=1 Tax=Paenibacillus dakarensis TaxID=1527293 RepID=UPI0006D543A1|nr:cupin domain-containing protein [Paenibacillus dakarensis]
MLYSSLHPNKEHSSTLVWNLQKHAQSFESGLRSDLTSDMIPLLNSMSMTEYTLQCGQTIPPHSHTDADELCYILNGEFSLSINQPLSSQHSPYFLTPGCAAFIPAGWLHQFVALKSQSRLLSIYNKDAPHLITALDAWNRVIQEELLHDEAAPVPVQPVFSTNVLSSKTLSNANFKRSSSPAPPLLQSSLSIKQNHDSP